MAARVESAVPEVGEDAPAVPARVVVFRDEYRATEIPRDYQPLLHLAFTFGLGTVALVACLVALDDVRPLEWLAVPATFLYANLAEYVGHRWPMHRPFRGLGLVYRRHAKQHHRYFTDDAMPLTDLTDLRAVLFPPLLVVFFFGLFGTPVWLALRFLVSANVAWLFVATALAYFLNYEILHTRAPPADARAGSACRCSRGSRSCTASTTTPRAWRT